MNLDFGVMFNAILGATVVGIAGTFLIVILIVVLVFRAFRRNGIGTDPAELELRSRLARGEIDMAEFEVRLRALRRGDAS